MKRSNYIVYGISLLASVVLLALWFILGFNKIDGPLDLMISVLWWGIIAVSVYLIVRAERQRKEQVRTIYVSHNALFNAERGLVRCEDPAQRVSVMQEILSSLTYSMSPKEMPSERDFACSYVVRTDDFAGSGEGDPTWKGSVVRIDRARGNSIRDFEGAAELAAVLA